MENKLIRKKGVLERSVGEERMLYDTLQRTVHVLNDTAYFLWQRCDGNHTLEQIAEEAANAYAVSVQVAREDLSECLAALKGMSLIEQVA